MPGELTPATLYLVPTPLGNLQDITLRAIETLRQADLIACEDTRRTLTLLNHLGISKPLVSYHAHSVGSRARSLIFALQEGKKVALVCDAGTPGLSDPGTELVQAVLTEKLSVCSLPGPCAAITALVGSGLPTDAFFFIGFLPRRPARAKRRLQEAAASGATVVLYESPYRTRSTVEWVRDLLGAGTRMVVARELSKVYEEYLRGTAGELADLLASRELKGEVVILFQKATEE
jgi:16S rRNA (cytidine1402-2'-O)-methyltransferase